MKDDVSKLALGRRHLPIAGSYNIRDLGGYRTCSGHATPWRRFLRADSLHRIGAAGVDQLLGEGLSTVIDLRAPSEVAASASPFASISGVAYHNLPVFDELAPAALGRKKAVCEDPLLEFYLTALGARQAAIGEILAAMAEMGEGAVMFNCTAGKDRTGIVAALLLALAGVERDDIIADYVLTADLIPDLVAEFLDLSRQNGGDVVAYEKMLRSPANTMSTALDMIDDRHGGVEGYLTEAGVSDSHIFRLRERLTVPRQE